MDNTMSLLLSIALLVLLCIPALIWLLRWLRSTRYALKQGQSFQSLVGSLGSAKCQSCGSKGGCASSKGHGVPYSDISEQGGGEQQATCPAAVALLDKFPATKQD